MIKTAKRLLTAVIIPTTLVISTAVNAGNYDTVYDLGFSKTISKLTLDTPATVVNTPPSLLPTVSVSENVTVAELSSSMNCATGDITISGAIPEISSFKDALKILAPYAIGDDGSIDFKNFLGEMMTEFATEESTESMLEYLAYVHYYITASMGDNPPAELEMFKTSEFKSCVDSVWANSYETDFQLGGSFGAPNDDFGLQGGLDITALFKIKKCFNSAKGPILPSQEEEDRYQESLRIVRSIFYKLLNSQMNFDLKQQTDLCKNYDKEVFGKKDRNANHRNFLLQNAHGGQRFSPDGSVVWMPVSVDELTVLKRADADDSSISANRSMDDTHINEVSSEVESDNASAISTGSMVTEKKIDLKVKVAYKPAPFNIDITDLNTHERITLFDKTSKDFLDAVGDSKFYSSLSTTTKYHFESLLEATMTMQSMNYKHVEDLACALDKSRCQLDSWLLEAEYDAVVKHNGYINKCIEMKNVAEKALCMNSRPQITFNENNQDVVTDKANQQEYVQHIIRFELLDMVEDYYKSLGAFTFAEDFDDEQLEIFNSTDYMKNKIILLKRARLLRDYWSAPIASLSQAALLDIKNSQESKYFSEKVSRDETYQMIVDIFEGNSGSSMSLTPYIYEPMNELQMAKFLYQMSDPALINLMLAATDSEGLGRAPSLPLAFEEGKTVDLFALIQGNNYKSITDSINYNGYDIHPIINNMKRSGKYTSLSVGELHNLAILMEKFKDFYVKRLVDTIGSRFNLFKENQMNELKNNSTPAAVATLKNEMSIIDFKQQQKREMLKLLVN